MDFVTSYLPITVILAIILFFLKETIEGHRRWRANVRKGRAYRKLLKRECELNHWTHNCLKKILIEVQKDFAKKESVRYIIKRNGSGKTTFRRESGSVFSERVLTHAHAEQMRKMLLDVAATDSKLFTYLEAAYDSAINLKHLRDSLIGFIETDDESHKNLLSGFLQYGLTELANILSDLERLYLECTNEKLKNARVR